tara:strand:- start:1464 stop:2789 length:1326 start_codon:yes stop_codon:yes gene_type:complete
MRLSSALIILLFITHCSFDDKTGIWKNSNNITKKENDLFKDFEKISTKEKSFKEVISPDKNYKIRLSKPVSNNKWPDIFFSQTNNSAHFMISDQNEIIFQSKKISKRETNEYLLYEGHNLITSNHRGHIIIYSIKDKEIISSFNFYKKKYKKIKIKVNLILENNIVYVSDNIGFLYAYDFLEKKILWAKNYKKPFRSNIKIYKNRLITSNQNNDLFIFDKESGEIVKQIPTEETIVKNQFINNLSLNQESIFFINTFGSLYSINKKNMNINWVVNLNPKGGLNYSNIFLGSEIINDGEKVIISSNDFLYVIDATSGSIMFKKNFSLKIKPIILDNHLFLITQNNMLSAINLRNGQIIYSFNINTKIADFLKVKQKKAEIKSFVLANNNILIFLKNSYLLKFSIYGDLSEIKKLPSKIKSYPIVINGNILYLNNKNKIIVIG